MSTRNSSRSISSIVREIVGSDPCLVDALISDYVNYSKLAARLSEVIREEYGVSCTSSSIKMALLRSKPVIAERSPKLRIFRILAESSLEVKTGLTIATYSPAVSQQVFKAVYSLVDKARFISIAQGVNNITIIVNNELIDTISKLIPEEPIWIERDVSAILLVSPVENIEIPGFISYITSLLARKGINILQILSAHSDTIIVVRKKDTIEAFKILDSAILKARGAGIKQPDHGNHSERL